MAEENQSLPPGNLCIKLKEYGACEISSVSFCFFQLNNLCEF